jgi:cytochrome c553
MNQIKYLLYACLILFGIVITTGVIKKASFVDDSDKPLPTQSVTIDTEPASPQGRQLFQQNCQSCHKIQGASPTAPALAGVLERGLWSDPAKLYAWVKNPLCLKTLIPMP